MSKKLILWGTVLVVLSLSACATTHTERPPNGAELYTYGHAIYFEYCAECHQTDGTGIPNIVPRLKDNPIVTLHDPTFIIETVTYGQGSMQAYRNTLTQDDIAAVLTYIRNTWGNHAVPVSPRQVQ
jgi:alcohol dehydrogenase (quinone), cytochrome c subunit